MRDTHDCRLEFPRISHFIIKLKTMQPHAICFCQAIICLSFSSRCQIKRITFRKSQSVMHQSVIKSLQPKSYHKMYLSLSRNITDNVSVVLHNTSQVSSLFSHLHHFCTICFVKARFLRSSEYLKR